MVECLICHEKVDEKETVVFSNGSHVCKRHVRELEEKIEKGSGFASKEELMNAIVRTSMERIANKSKEDIAHCMETLGPSGLLDYMTCDERIKEYDELIEQVRKELDKKNELTLDEIRFNSEFFHKKVASIFDDMFMDTPMFKMIHTKEYELIPDDDGVIDDLFGGEFNMITFMMKTVPLIFCLRAIWRAHETAKAKDIFDCFLKYHTSSKLKEYFKKDSEKYQFVVSLLEPLGPISLEEMKMIGEALKNKFGDASN